jgi:hypothetical protein
MARPRERTEVCDDLDLRLDLVARGYKNLRVTSEALGLPYDVVRRVATGQPCTPEELEALRMAWAKRNPETVLELIDEILGDVIAGRQASAIYAKDLRQILRRLVRLLLPDANQ